MTCSLERVVAHVEGLAARVSSETHAALATEVTGIALMTLHPRLECRLVDIRSIEILDNKVVAHTGAVESQHNTFLTIARKGDIVVDLSIHDRGCNAVFLSKFRRTQLGDRISCRTCQVGGQT